MPIRRVERDSFLSSDVKIWTVSLESGFTINTRILELFKVRMVSINFPSILFARPKGTMISGRYQILASEVINECASAIFLDTDNGPEIPAQAVFQLLKEDKLPRKQVVTAFVDFDGEEVKRLDFWWNNRLGGWCFDLRSFNDSPIPKGNWCLEPVPAEMSC
jgi:hypothetical protein